VISAGLPIGVGKTALGAAMVRAHESRRADRLFNDPYAEAFLMAAPGAFDAQQRAAEAGAGDLASWGAVLWSHAVIRTRFFDDYLVDATARGIRQVVLLAAGLDTRAYRLRWPHGVRVYELDLPEVMGFKGKVLTERRAASRCERTVVPIDLRKDWTVPLFKAGLSSSEPTAWLAEGLLIYLSARESADLLTRVGELSASRSRVGFEVENLGTDLMRTQARQTPTMQQHTKLWKGGLPDASEWLAENGWKPQLHDRATVALSYGRPQAGPSNGGFVVAARA
jgi:methyltransferase (TIGR00027 family)